MECKPSPVAQSPVHPPPPPICPRGRRRSGAESGTSPSGWAPGRCRLGRPAVPAVSEKEEEGKGNQEALLKETRAQGGKEEEKCGLISCRFRWPA